MRWKPSPEQSVGRPVTAKQMSEGLGRSYFHNFESLTGRGVRAKLKQRTYYVGNRKADEDNGIRIENRVSEHSS